MMRLRTTRDRLLLALVIILGVMVAWRLAMIPIAAIVKFSWTLTPLASLVLSAVVSALMAVAAVLVAVMPPAPMSIAAIVLGMATVPVLGMGWFSVGIPFAVLVGGVACLEAGSLVAGRRAGEEHAGPPRLLAGVTLLLLLVTFGGLFLGVLGTPEERFTDTRSPDGAWTVTVREWNSMFGGGVTVSVHRAWAGVLEQRRTIYRGDWGEIPTTTWVDWHTVSINGGDLELYWDAAIDEEEWE